MQNPCYRPLLRCAVVLIVPAVLAQSVSAQDERARVRRLQRAQPAQMCVAGYVWREALAGDAVCVDPARREAVRYENTIAASRAQPGGGAYGPDTCRRGYVWRAAGPDDHVCVMPESRDMVARENARASQLWSACGSPVNCERELAGKRARVEQLTQQINQRKRDLARAREDYRRLMEQLRKDDEAWARAHPGLGRSTQPSVTDNVTPIEQDIRSLEAALREAEQAAAQAQAQAEAPSR